MELSPSGKQNAANYSWWKSVYSEIDKYKNTEEKLRIPLYELSLALSIKEYDIREIKVKWRELGFKFT